ncbi:MAG: hypothetical protein WC159_10630 [Sphaerochaetaceae bacterium]
MVFDNWKKNEEGSSIGSTATSPSLHGNSQSWRSQETSLGVCPAPAGLFISSGWPETLAVRALSDAIMEFAGVVVIHDRYFSRTIGEKSWDLARKEDRTLLVRMLSHLSYPGFVPRIIA